MKFEKNEFKDVCVITKEPFIDQRGQFMRTFCVKEFEQNGLPTNLVQTNLSITYDKSVIRGMHRQIDEFSEDKLVQCIKGSIYDVIIDLRKDSKTYGKYFGIELNENNNKMLLVPRGFAHGFLTLSENCYVTYQVSNFYNGSSERGIRWNDPFFDIKWPCKNPILSQKDSSWQDYKD